MLCGKGAERSPQFSHQQKVLQFKNKTLLPRFQASSPLSSDNYFDKGQARSDKRKAHSPSSQSYFLDHSGWTSLSPVVRQTTGGSCEAASNPQALCSYSENLGIESPQKHESHGKGYGNGKGCYFSAYLRIFPLSRVDQYTSTPSSILTPQVSRTFFSAPFLFFPGICRYTPTPSRLRNQAKLSFP